MTTPGNVGGAGGEGAGAQAAGTPPGGEGAPGAAGGAGAPDWTASLPEDLRGYVQLKQFKDPAALTESYRNLEKLTGVPQERLLKLPEKDEDPAWGDIHKRLGRPERAEDYKIDLPAQGADPELAKGAREAFHKLGISAKQAEGITKFWNEYAGKAATQSVEAVKAKAQAEDQALRTEWGAAYDKNWDMVERAADQFGFGETELGALKASLGAAGAAKLLQSLGAKMGEDTFEGGTGTKPGFGNVMTPASAKAKITALTQDKDFYARLVNGNADARAEWDHLHMMANPPQT